MSAMSAVMQRLIDEAVVSEGASGNIYYEQARTDAPRPYVILMQDSTTPTQTKSGDGGLDFYQIRVLCFDDNLTDALTLAGSCKTALNRARWTEGANSVHAMFAGESTASARRQNKEAFMAEQTYDVTLK